MRAWVRNTLLLLAMIFVTNSVIEDRADNQWKFWLLIVLAAACVGIREEIRRERT